MLMSWVKRVVPFVLALTLGLFVASFFVSVGLPKVKYERRGWKRHYENNCRMKAERDVLRFRNEQLRRDNERMRDQLRNEWRFNRDFEHIEVPPPPSAPIAPVAPIVR